MATQALTRRWRTSAGRVRPSQVALAVAEAAFLGWAATRFVQRQVVEDYREELGDQIVIHMKAVWTGDLLAVAILVLGLLLPVAVQRLRREPVLLVAVQAFTISLGVAVIYPLIQVFLEAFKAEFTAAEYSLAQFRRLMGLQMVRGSVGNTLLIGSISASLATLIGTVMAYALTLTDIPWRKWLRVLVILPLISPPFAVSFAVIMLFGRRGVITWDLLKIRDWSIYGPDGIILVQLIASIPLVALILSAVFAAMSQDLEEAAEDLGGRTLYVLRTVTFPLVLPAIATVWLLSFISSISDFGNPMLIGGGYRMLATQAYIQMIENFDLQLGAALSMLLLIPALIAFVLAGYISGRRSYVTVTGGARAARIRRLPGWLHWPLFGLAGLLATVSLLLYGSIFVGAAVNAWGFDYSLTLRNVRGLEIAIPELRNSLLVATTAGLAGGLFGVALAWLVSRQRFRGRTALDFAGTVLFAVPGTVIGVGYILAFNAHPFFWTGTFFIIILAFAFKRLPVGLRTGVAASRQIDPSLEEASLDLGATRPRTFALVTFPLLHRAFLAGVIYIFIRSMTDLSTAIFVNAGATQLYTVRMLRVMITGTPSEGAAFAGLLIVIILIALGLLSKVTGKSFVDLFRL